MSSYWQKRQEQLDKALEKEETALKKRLLKVYENEAAKLDREIAAYYQKYGKNNVIEYAELFEKLSDEDIKLDSKGLKRVFCSISMKSER